MDSTQHLELIAGDASDRKFYRSKDPDKGNSICMEFPKWEGGYGGDPLSWLGMQEALVKMGILVPEVIKIDKENSCIWIEDLGDHFLSSFLTEPLLDIKNKRSEQALQFYKTALSLLVKVQYPEHKIEHPALQRLFDFEKLYGEMDFFIKNFLNELLGLDVHENNPAYSDLFSELKQMCETLGRCDHVLCHRDYHARNLMIKNNQLYWIDFQDARMGPHSYDVVSLVRDSYIDITWDTRENLFDFYLQEVNKKRIQKNLKPISQEDYETENLLMGLQRNIKALGSFAYLACEKSKNSYLKYVLPTLNILCSKEARIQSMPHTFHMLERLFSGDLSIQLKKCMEAKHE